jgi:hypothetical protein
MSKKGQLLTLRRSIELVRFVPESGRVIYFLRGIWMGYALADPIIGLIITTLKSSNAAQAEAI